MTTGADALKKGLAYLDRGAFERGRSLLEEAIDLGQAAGDTVTATTARCALGELLVELGEVDVARRLLQVVANLDRDDDVLAFEVARANDLLRRLDEQT